MSTKGLDFLNATLQDISRAHNFREMYQISSGTAGTSVTVASTKNYTFPTDWKVILDMRILDGLNSRKLTLINPRNYDRSIPYPEGDSTGVPWFYVPLGNTFDLGPIPDDKVVTLTGSIDTTAATTVLGVGTLFLTELVAGDRIRVSQTVAGVTTTATRIVDSIVSNTELEVTVAFADFANDPSPKRLDGYTMPIRYIKKPAIVSATTTLIDYEPDKDPMIVSGMTAEFLDYLQLYQDAAIHRSKFRVALKEAILADEYQLDYSPVGKGFDSGYNSIFIGEYWNDPFIRSNP
jgi:hypothetical protein